MNNNKHKVKATKYISHPAVKAGKRKLCAHCKLEIVDFAGMSDDEIFDYQISHYNDRVCISYNGCEVKKPSRSVAIFNWFMNLFSRQRHKARVSYSQ